MFHIVLFEPEIPPNTGNIIRLSAICGCRLHLVDPLGFSLDDTSLRRAGLDYREYTEVERHKSWQACQLRLGDSRYFAISTRGKQRYDRVRFEPNDAFVFGPESRGLPVDMLEKFEADRRLRLPMMPQRRSLNLSNAVAIMVYEAWRQQGFARGA